jgi:hypothetical protein
MSVDSEVAGAVVCAPDLECVPLAPGECLVGAGHVVVLPVAPLPRW